MTDVWGGDSSQNFINADATFLAQSFVVAVRGKTVFNLTDFAYVPDVGSVAVYVNGVFQTSGINYTETSGTVITLASGTEINDLVTVVAKVGVTGAADAAVSAASAAASLAAIQALNIPNLPLVISQGGTGQITKDAAFLALAPTPVANKSLLSLDGVSYVLGYGGPLFPEIRSSGANVQIVTADTGKLVRYTVGGFTQTIADCVTLTAGHRVQYKNESTSNIIFDPYLTQTIGGVATAIMRPGDHWEVVCDGANLVLNRIKGKNNSRITVSGNYTVEAGVYKLGYHLCGGGGSGGRGSGANNGDGGAAGGESYGTLSVTPGQVLAVVIGAGGLTTTVDNTLGNSGGSSTFGGVTCTGGDPGNNSAGYGSTGGIGSAGDTNIQGGRGGFLTSGNNVNSRGGDSTYGRGGITISTTNTLPLSSAYGVGGSSTQSGNNSVPGNPGVLDLDWI